MLAVLETSTRPGPLDADTLGLASLFPAAALAWRRIEPLVVGLLLLLAV